MTPFGLKFGEKRKETTILGERWVAAARPTEEFRKAWTGRAAHLTKLGYTWKGRNYPVHFWKKVLSDEEEDAIRTASRAEDANIDIPRPSCLEYRPFQRGGIAFAMPRVGTLIGDEMGLGKTIQAIGVANAMGARRIMVGCPASLKMNWYAEIQKWQVLYLPVFVISSGVHMPRGIALPEGWWIVSWEIAQKFERELKTTATWDLVILDEIHKLKTMTALRTKFFLGGEEKTPEGKKKIIPPIRATKRLALTGTPICNRPLELFSFLAWLQPAQFKNLADFKRRFCNSARDLALLQYVLCASVIVRRLRSQWLKELQPKQRQVMRLDVKVGTYGRS